jgi:hypothetical protein
VTGTLPTANGGTNLTSFTSGGVVYASSSSALATSSNLSHNGTTLTLKNGYYEAYDPTDSTSAGLGTRFYTDGGGTKTENGRLTVAQSGTGSALSSMIFQTNNGTSLAEQMRLTSTGLGIGTSSPSTKLHVEAADGVVGGAIKYTASGVASGYMSADPNGLCLATDTAGITFRTGVTGNDPTDTGSERARIDSSGNLLIGGTTAPTSSTVKQVIQTASGGFAQFGVSGGTGGMLGAGGENLLFYTYTGSLGSETYTERARIVPFGIQSTNSISVGGATPTTSGAGITFPATQSASSDANTLDDYEEGTWTPALGGFSSITYSAQTGTYTKIGNVVNVVCKMVVTGGTRTSQDLQVFSLPFTSASQENSGGSWGYGYGVVANTLGLPQLRINASATTVSLLNTAGGVLSGTDLNTATPTINFSATYTV